MIFLTFNEAPSGIFSSQVADVVNFLKEDCGGDVKLWSFVSLRSFFKTRKKIRLQVKGAKVIPMFPTMRLWKMNRLTLSFLLLFSGERKIMARSVWATWLALSAAGKKRRVIYDGRGAVYHESKEYAVVTDEKQRTELKQIEQHCIDKSDFLLAVSEKLAEFWRTFYGYTGNRHVVIPCTLNSSFFRESPEKTRDVLPFLSEDSNCVYGVYSGSNAGWQSVSDFVLLAGKILHSNPQFRLLVLSRPSAEWNSLSQEFPGRVCITFVSPPAVPALLKRCDYGFLIRENSVTNSVASPVKFAEYLACGLKVIISPQIGDYSDFTSKHNCGYLFSEGQLPAFVPVDGAEKERMRQLARAHFTKEVFKNDYLKILAF